MNTQERTLARILFQNKIYKANGQAFENLFCDIMSYAHPGFRRIKAWGNIGDKKNDGYIEDKGCYYQVHAPENSSTSYVQIVKKIETDFNGLLKNWSNIQEFYFVINDKYLGVHADAEQILTKIKDTHNLNASGFITSDNLEHLLFSLSEDQIQGVIGSIPNPEQVVNLDYTVLNEVIGFIMKLPLVPIVGIIKYPDWNEKIIFNGLSDYSASLLNYGSQTLGALEKFLSTRTSLADDLQEHITAIYVKIKQELNDLPSTGDNIFWAIVNECSPRNEGQYQLPILTLMAKYFESCDIFEEPK